MTDAPVPEDLPRARTIEELRAGLERVRAAPRQVGRVELIVRRPEDGRREVLEEGELTADAGLVGDNWCRRPCRHTPDQSPDPERQLNLMGARAVQLVAGAREYWPLAGDQLYLDLDLSQDSTAPGTRLELGDRAVVEVTPPPHRGCEKFIRRFGQAAAVFFNGEEARRLNLRGVNARVVRPGRVRVGDRVVRLEDGDSL